MILKLCLNETIKRISFETEKLTFEQLLALITDAYGSGNWAIHFVDDEDENITIKSTAEVEEALRIFGGLELTPKFFVTPIEEEDVPSIDMPVGEENPLGSLLKSLSTSFENLSSSTKTQDLSSVMKGLSDAFQNAGSVASNLTTQAYQGGKTALEKMPRSKEDAKETAKEIGENARNAVVNGMESVKNSLPKDQDEAIQMVKDVTDQTVKMVNDGVEMIKVGYNHETTQQVLSSMKSGLETSFALLTQKIGELKDTLDSNEKTQGLTDFLKEMGDKLSELGKKVSSIVYGTTNPQPAPEDVEDPVVHLAVTCDGCQEGPLVGIRYKCAVCDNLDFCEACEVDGIHNGHPLLKIRTPGQAPTAIIVSMKDEDEVPEMFGQQPRRRHRGRRHHHAHHGCDGKMWHRGGFGGRGRGRGRGGSRRGRGGFFRQFSELFRHGPAHQEWQCPPAEAFQQQQQQQQQETVVSEEPKVTEEKKQEEEQQQQPIEIVSDVSASPVEEVKTEVVDEKPEVIEPKVEAELVEEEPKMVVSEKVKPKKLTKLEVPAIKPRATVVDSLPIPEEMTAGQKFVKTFVVRNDSAVVWPAGCRIHHVACSRMGMPQGGMEIPSASPGESVTIKIPLQAPEQEGRHTANFRLKTSDGKKFGQRLWVALSIDKMTASSDEEKVPVVEEKPDVVIAATVVEEVVESKPIVVEEEEEKPVESKPIIVEDDLEQVIRDLENQETPVVVAEAMPVVQETPVVPPMTLPIVGEPIATGVSFPVQEQVVAQPIASVPINPFAAHLETLETMGFHDREMNQELCVRFNGDMGAIVGTLCSM
eukprot:TRINITY_DN52_c0_g1_i1.p1 TRINITY_DN52_c0_g1~~TRINITY_DN52_c0_g1_i1.p1  ORF type:complete len:844 (-),score=393.66 TRINITY_DN52_c0_g1_i1:164-2611(-)